MPTTLRSLAGHATRVALASLVLTAVAAAQDIEITPRLRAGDEFQLEIVRVRQNSARPQSNAKGKSLVDVRVISVDSKGIILEWVPQDTPLDNNQLAQDPTLVAAAKATAGLRLRLSLAPDGELLGLANEAEVKPKLQAAVDLMMKEFGAKIPEDQRRVFQKFMSQVLSPATILGSVTNDAKTYFALNGVALAAGETVEAEMQQPNPFGGEPLPAKFRVRVESATPESATLTTTTAYDPAALQRMTQMLAAQAGKPIPPEELAKIPPMELTDEGRFTFDRTIGLMREVIVNRRVTAGPMRRIDDWEIRLVRAPKR